MKARLPAAVLAAVILAGCSVDANGRARIADEDDVPFALLDPDAPAVVPTTVVGEVGEPVTLCFLRDRRLVVVERQFSASVTPEMVVRALSSPPPEGEAPARTALSDPLVVRDVAVVAGIARVDLSQSIAELGGEDQLLAVAQIVCTLTARPGVGQVAFTLEGTPIEVPRGDGSLVSQPVSRDDYASLFTG